MLKKIKNFWEDGIMKLPGYMAEASRTVNTLINKVLGENEKCAFYLKVEELFGQPNSF